MNPKSKSDEYYILSPEDTDPARISQEREKARKLKKSSWWQKKAASGICHYCEGKFSSRELTMDHLVPLARGGKSTPGNLVPCCRECNQAKRLRTPAEEILKKIRD